MSSNRRSGPPAHQNATAWVPNRADKHNSLQKKVNELKIDGVCQRCKDAIEWKRTYGKYKPLKQPSKCVGCGQKAVQQAYHVLCSPCSSSREVCAKCMVGTAVKDDSEDALLAADIKLALEAMQWMNERDRRTTKRKIANGEDLSAIVAAAKEATAAHRTQKEGTPPAAAMVPKAASEQAEKASNATTPIVAPATKSQPMAAKAVQRSDTSNDAIIMTTNMEAAYLY